MGDSGKSTMSNVMGMVFNPAVPALNMAGLDINWDPMTTAVTSMTEAILNQNYDPSYFTGPLLLGPTYEQRSKEAQEIADLWQSYREVQNRPWIQEPEVRSLLVDEEEEE